MIESTFLCVTGYFIVLLYYKTMSLGSFCPCGHKARKKTLVLVNWFLKIGPVARSSFFLEPQPKFSKSNELCLHAEMDAEAEVAT